MKHVVIGLITIVVASAAFFGSSQIASAESKCGGTKTSYLSCPTGSNDTVEDSNFWKLLETALNILAGLVGIVAVGGIVYGAIMYASAQDNESQVQQAKDIIRGVVIGLVAFIGMYALLQYLLPGGIFS